MTKKNHTEDYPENDDVNAELSDVILNYVRPNDESFETARKDIERFVDTCPDICEEFQATPSKLTRDFWRRR